MGTRKTLNISSMHAHKFNIPSIYININSSLVEIVRTRLRSHFKFKLCRIIPIFSFTTPTMMIV